MAGHRLDVRYFPKGFFPRATSQDYLSKWQLPESVLAAALGTKPILAAALGPLVHPSHSARPPNCTLGKLTLGKLSLGKSAFEKCLWEST